jgi:DNA-binding transcriptional MocR family regulator
MAPKNNYFPSDELSKSLVRVIRSYPYDININGLSEELEIVTVSFRKLTSDFMFRTCGIAVSDEEICTTYGASEALMYAISASTKPGGMVAVEDPGFMGVRSSIHFLKLNHIEIPTTPPHGLDIDRFELLLDYGLRPSCLVVTPNFQNPTGSLMPLENRQRLIALCKRYSIVLIEDDVLGALRYGPSVPVLKSLSPDDVIYVSSFSKILAPGYHTGWFCAGKYTKSLESMRPFVPSATSNLSQLAVAQYLSEGKAKNYLQRLRKTYERNRDIMAEAIRDGFPENTDVFVPQGGQYLWVQMPENVSANEMYFEARKKNILLAPGVLFSQQCHFQNCLRFCYALEMTPDIIDAIGYVGGLAKKRIQ